MKNASRNKFLLCFRPVVDMDQLVLEPKGDIVQSKNRALACAPMGRKEILRRSMSNSSLSDYSTSSGLILQSAKKNISQSMRVSDTEKRLREDRPKISKRSFSMRRKKSFDVTKDFSVNRALKTRDFTTNSVLSPSSSSESSSLSGSSPLSEPNQEREVISKNQKIKNMKSETKKENLDRTGLSSVLVSLAVTVFWGKAFAIIFTSLWLYFQPRRCTENSICQPEYVSRVPESRESKENKKRVIIEGLLERNHQQISNRWWGGSINYLT